MDFEDNLVMELVTWVELKEPVKCVKLSLLDSSRRLVAAESSPAAGASLPQ